MPFYFLSLLRTSSRRALCRWGAPACNISFLFFFLRRRSQTFLTCFANTAMSSLKDSDEQTSPPATPGSLGVHVANSHFSKISASKGNRGCLGTHTIAKCHQREQRRGQDDSRLDLASHATPQQLAHGDSLLQPNAIILCRGSGRKEKGAAKGGQDPVIKI